MKIAIVHDQLQEFGGAERVLVSLKKIYPEADIYTSFYSPEKLGNHAKKLEGWKIYTSWADKVPFIKRWFSPLRFITPLIWESFDLSGYDVVISSSGAYMCKGIVTRPETLHVCYLHHQPKYLYFYETPSEWQKHRLIKIYGTIINHDLRMFDYLSSERVDYFISNSEEIKKRIAKFYRRDATVIYPPVSIPNESQINIQNEKRDYYLVVSRLAVPKHIELAIQAATKMKRNLKVVGIGKDLDRLKTYASEYVEFLGGVSDSEFTKLFDNAKAFLNGAVDEDFGIAVVEALGRGVPVIAYASGGIKETIENGKNGYLFDMFSPDALIEKMKELEDLSAEKYLQMRLNARKSSEKYSEENFMKQIKNFVEMKKKIFKRDKFIHT